MKKKIVITIVSILILASIISIILILIPKKEEKEPQEKTKPYQDDSYNLKLIKAVNRTQENNYLISPYSIEIALNMLKEGAAGTSRKEIEAIIPERSIPNIAIKDRIGLANATFIKEEYQPFIKDSFISSMKKNYQAEVILDNFQTPDKINNWVKKNTNDMISKILDDISENFVLGIANAIAIDVNWAHQFECLNTTEATFHQENNIEKKVEMMHNTYSNKAQFFQTDDAKGIILPYFPYNQRGEVDHEGGSRLEFMGILPDNNVNAYIEKLTEEELKKIDAEKKDATYEKQIKLSLPRFQYDFDLEEFMNILKVMGIKEVFDEEKADLTGIMTRDDMSKINATNLYVSKAIHKTHIDLNEQGTKAAATTYFGVKENSVLAEEPQYIEINFNKPFIYIIRDYKTKEVLFFGVVREPNTWKGTTCEE